MSSLTLGTIIVDDKVFLFAPAIEGSTVDIDEYCRFFSRIPKQRNQNT